MRPLLASVAALCALATPHLATSAPTITEYSSGITAGAAPHHIAAAGDGTLWFTENGLGRLGRITTGGTVTEFSSGLTAGGGPWGIAAASGGGLWFTENGLLGSVGRATTLGAVTLFTSGLTIGGGLRDIAEGPDGNLWATWSANPGRIVRITPSGTITEFTAGLQNNNAPTGITAGPDGNVWFTEKSTPARIGRITPAGVITEFHTNLTNGSDPDDIVTGPDGNLWFTQEDGIGRITPAGVITEFTAGVTPNSRPSGIAAGPDGALWFTEETNPGRIGRITTDGVVSQFTAGLTPNGRPLGITRGPDGRMWFTENGGDRVGAITTHPAVSSGLATLTGAGTATITATVTPNTEDASFSVQYGPTSAYGTPSATVPVPAALTPQAVSVTIAGLVAGGDTHFRTVATNASGTSYGPATIITPSGATAPAPADPAPAAGRKVVAGPVAGVIRVRRPGSSSFVTLDAAAQVPVGSVFDSSRGRIEVVSALPGGATQSATFWGGVFQVKQTAGADGTIDIHLQGPAPACRATVKRAVGHSENAVRRPVARRLWGKDSHGRYRTHGRNSVATVRGTEWLTRETCAGTLTRVTEGAVAVRDTLRKRTVLVRAGGSHLVRARR